MIHVILNSDGTINWNANGWPDPNPEGLANDGYFSTEGMPEEVFEEWEALCDNLNEDWSIDW